MLKITKRYFFRILLLLSGIGYTGIKVQAQQDQIVKDLVENLAESLPDDYDISELTERLALYKKHPIDLNHTNTGELKNLFFLSPLQISNFFTHIKTNGALLEVFELQSIDGFDAATIQKLLPFVTLNVAIPYSKLSFKDLISRGNSSLILRYAQTLQTQKGFTDLPGSRYLGGPEKLLGKYRYNYKNLLSASLVFKKDAGEYLFAGNHKISFDFVSGNVALNNLGRIKKLVFGDYNLQFGQGLTLWSGFGYGKGPDVTSVAKKDSGLTPYTSSNESSFFRGTAAILEIFKNIDLIPFVSLRRLDASLSATTAGTLTLVNLGTSGLHRTATEIKNKKSQGQLIYGSALQYTGNNLTIGIVAYHSKYEHEFITGTQAYNAFGFTGKKLNNIGLYYNYTFKNIYFYGEAASSLDGGTDLVNGAMTSLSHTLSIVLVHRYYDKDYHDFYSQGIGENAESSNEKGWYAGFNLAAGRLWTVAVYTDVFSFPWLKYRTDAASSGYEILGQISYVPTKNFKGIVRIKTKLNAQNPDDKLSEELLVRVYKENYRLKANWRFNRAFSFQDGIEAVQYKKGDAPAEIGYLIYQDAGYAPLSSKLSANIRLAYFHTASYNSRVYAYENDVLYGFSFGMYNGIGFRTYLNLRYRFTRRLNIWTRYAISIYPKRETIGSGLDVITGNKKSEIKIQLRYEF